MLLRSTFTKSLCRHPLNLKHLGSIYRTLSYMPHGDYMIGIDFGSSNTRVAILDEELVPKVALTPSGRAIPTRVAVDENSNILVGKLANIHSIKHPEDMFFKIKNLIGRNFNDPKIQELVSNVPFKIIKGPKREALLEARNKQFTPTQVLSYIFADMKRLAELNIGRSVSKTVIAVPFDFNADQREEVKLAGKMADLDVFGIVDEPIAAARSCNLIKDGKVVVCCLGSAAFNFYVLEVSDAVIHVKCSSSGRPFGGDDFDNLLFQYMAKCDSDLHHKLKWFKDEFVLSRLKVAAIRSKHLLSFNESTEMNVNRLSALSKKDDTFKFTRKNFEKCVSSLVEKTKSRCITTLEDADISPEEVDQVIMAGGMAKMPLLQETIEELFGLKASMWINPEEAVVLGAVNEGSFIMEDEKVLSPSSVPLSLGIEARGGFFAPIIRRDSNIPMKVQRTISPSVDYQGNMPIRIYMGENDMACHNVPVGDFILTGLPPVPAGILKYDLSFELIKNETLVVSAKHDKMHSVTKTFVIPKMREEDIKKASKEALLNRFWRFRESYFMEIREVAHVVLDRGLEVLEKKSCFLRFNAEKKKNL